MATASINTLLRRKLFLLVLAPSAAFILVLGGFIAYRQYSALKERNTMLSQSLAHYVSIYVEEALHSLRHLSLSTNTDDAPRTERLANMYSSYPHFERLMHVDEYRIITAAYPSGLTGVDFPLHFAAPETLESGTLSKPVYSPETDALVIYLGYPARDGGEYIAELSLESLREHLNDFSRENEKSTIMLTDNYGNVVVHPDERMVRQQVNLGGWELFQGLARTGTVFRLFEHEGEFFFGTVTAMQTLGWRLVLSTPLHAVFFPVAQTVLGLIIFLGAFFTVAVASFRYELQRRIVLPLTGFAASLQLAARGDYAPPRQTEEATFNELEVIEREFLSMAERIGEREVELRTSRQHLRGVIDSLSIALLSVNDQLRITLMNTSAEALCGISPEEARGLDALQTFPLLEHARKQLLAAVTLRKASVLENVAVEEGSRSSRFDIGIYPLVDEAGAGAVVRIEDVTTRSQLEEIMIQTEKMMSVGGLAAGMAHEINNPLSGILQSAQNITRRVDPDLPANRKVADTLGVPMDGVRGYMDKRGILKMLSGIVDSGQRAASIVSNMLDFSRRSTSTMGPCDVHALIENVISLASSDYDLKKRYDFRKITINRDFDPALGAVNCTETEIEQVLLNLFKNAAQAMNRSGKPNGDPTLTVTTRAAERHAEIRVRDNGPGIGEEHRKRIFEPFFTTKEPGEGTGLGLSVSYFIITNNHKGSFTVDSVPGQGAEFIISLPYALDDEDAPPQT